ncbi:MAG: hypothetical protein HZB50_06905 [Chloroflexi bacterium]|nr:hypothetical protein [Chloroflexota bacterium]
MDNVGSILLQHVLALIFINLVGLACFGAIFYLVRKATSTTKAKMLISAEIGLISVVLLGILSGNLGIYFWVKSGSFRAIVMGLPLIICGTPILFPVVAIGTYVQLGYKDKIQNYVNFIVTKKLGINMA